MLPLDSTGLNMKEYFLLDKNEMKKKLFVVECKRQLRALCGKDTFEFILK